MKLQDVETVLKSINIPYHITYTKTIPISEWEVIPLRALYVDNGPIWAECVINGGVELECVSNLIDFKYERYNEKIVIDGYKL